MAIQFPCPSCQQPIEVDDPCGGESVACPYCQRVVTAPQASTWPAGQIPQAHPTRPTPPAPPPQASPYTAPGAYPPMPPTSSRRSASKALALAIGSTVLTVFAVITWFVSLFAQILDKAGPDASPEQAQQAMQEILQNGTFQAPTIAIVALFAGVFCGLAGLILAVRSLLRQETHRTMAVIACLVCACFLCCQLVMMLVPFSRPMP